MKLLLKNKKQAFFLLAAFCLLISAASASAHTTGSFWAPGQPLVPCGNIKDAQGIVINPCTKCELWHLLKHLIDFILIAAAPILATVFFIVAGVYMMLGGANPGMLSTGKSIFRNTFTGLLIIMLSWLLVNTLIQSIADQTVYNTYGNGNWYSYSCTESSNVNAPPAPPGNTQPQIVTISNENVINLAPSNATITWTTNIPASSTVEYTEVGNPVWTSSFGPGNTTSHSVLAPGLLSGRNYVYHVISVGGTNNYRAVGSDFTFRTP